MFQHPCFSQDQNIVDSLNHEFKNHGHDTTGVLILGNMSEFFYFQSEYYKAIECAKQCLALSEQIGYKRGVGIARQKIGRVYIEQGNYGDALKEQFTALKIMREEGDQKGCATSLITIGLIYNYQSNYKEALKYYQSALTICNSINDKLLLHRCYTNLGWLSFREKEYPEAINYYLSCIKIGNEMNDKLRNANTYHQIADCYYEMENYPEASDYYFKSLKQGEETGSKDAMMDACGGLGRISVKSHKYTAARGYFNKELMLSKDIGNKLSASSAYAELSALDSIEGNFKQSLDNYKNSILYRDSIFNNENTQKITQQQMQYDFDKKEALTKAESEKELQKQKLVRNGFVGGFAVVLLFAGVFFRQRNKTNKEKKKSDELLLNILPAEVASELKTSGSSKAKAFTMVTVMFTDFKDFTTVSEKISAELLVDEIHHCFSAFDNILHKYKIEKIKTIGDAYLCASGLPVSNYTHAFDMLHAAFEIRNFMLQRKKEKEARGEIPFELRIGIHTGPVVAGIVGVKKYAYDIWGDTVNLAARMEQNSEAGKINISGSTYELVKDKFKCGHRGKIQAKNKGEIDMYFVEVLAAKL